MSVGSQGSERFLDLVKSGFLNGNKFFRVVPGFIVQFGLSGNPDLNQKWQSKMIEVQSSVTLCLLVLIFFLVIKDDEVVVSNTRGRVSFATSGPNSRTTQLFINYEDNDFLDEEGFAPFGEVVEGMEEVVDKIFPGYGERLDQYEITYLVQRSHCPFHPFF